MLDDIRHAVDFQLVEACLGGLDEPLRDLQKKYEPMLRAFMLSSGASDAEAREILASLWTDCVIGMGSRRARFSSYHGQSPLIAWLKTVVMNELIDRRRRAKRQEPLTLASENPNNSENGGSGMIEPTVFSEPGDSPFYEIMHGALTSALEKCPLQTLVMLQLVYLNGLTQREVAKMWGWTDAKVSRTLSAGMQTIREETMQLVKKTDAWLELRWEDFIELCSHAEFPFLN